MYMNKTKRNLIIASAIINLIGVTASLVLSILLKVNPPLFAKVIEYLFFISYSFNIYYVVFSFAAGVVASVFLLYSVRAKGKYFRTTQGLYIAGFIIVIVCGGTLAWLLLFISMFLFYHTCQSPAHKMNYPNGCARSFRRARPLNIKGGIPCPIYPFPSTPPPSASTAASPTRQG